MSCFPWRKQPLAHARGSVVTHALLRAASPLLATLLLAAQPVIRVGVPLIVAPTSVTDRSGNFINGLSAADFQLYDNDVPQLIHEDGDFLPISVAIAIQSNLNKHAVERVHELGPLLGALVVGVGGEAAIFTFNHQLDVRQDFTPGPRPAHPRAATHRIFARTQPRHRRHTRCHASSRPAPRAAAPHPDADFRVARHAYQPR